MAYFAFITHTHTVIDKPKNFVLSCEYDGWSGPAGRAVTKVNNPYSLFNHVCNMRGVMPSTEQTPRM